MVGIDGTMLAKTNGVVDGDAIGVVFGNVAVTSFVAFA